MENKAPITQNLQDVYLNTLRRERQPATIFLLGGVKLIGRIKGFDKYSIVLETNNQEQLIFKHAISTVTTARFGPPLGPPPGPPPPPPESPRT